MKPRARCLRHTSPLSRLWRMAAWSAPLAVGCFGPALAATWSGNGADALWTTGQNWQGGSAPTTPDALVFDGGVQTVNTNDFVANTRFDGIVFLAGSSGFTLAGNAIDLGGDVTNLSASTQYLNLDLRLRQDTLFDLGSSALVNNGVISDGGDGYGITKTGTGTWHPRGANTYTGATAVRRGTVYVDFNAAGTPEDNMISAESPLVVGGEGHNVSVSLRSQNSRHSVQSFDGVAFQPGRTSFPLSRNGSAGSMTLNLGTVTRSAGGCLGTVGISSVCFANIDPATPLQHGILGGWATIGNHWATHSGGALAAYGAYATLAGTDPVIADDATANVTFDAAATGTVGVASSANISTLRCTDILSRTVDIGIANTLRLGAVGGIFRAVTTTSNALTIANGALTAGGTANTAGELVVNAGGATASTTSHANNGIRIQSDVTDNGTGRLSLTKTGPQGAVLEAPNGYSGDTHILQGKLVSTVLNNLGGDVHVYNCIESAHGAVWLSAAGDYTNIFFIAGPGPNEKVGTIDYSRGALCFGNSGARTVGTVTLVGGARVATPSGGTGTLLGRVTGTGTLTVGSGSQVECTIYLHNPANDWTGNTFITSSSSSSGKHVILRLGASEVIPHGPNAGNVQMNCDGASSGTSTFLELRGFDETINGLTSYGRSERASQRIVQNGSGSVNCALTLGDNDADGTFMGVVRNGSTGTLSVRKIGAGKQVLSWSCSYTGSTVVDGGELEVSGSLTGTGGVDVGADATFAYTGAGALDRAVEVDGGTFRHSSTNETGYTGTLTFTAGRVAGTNWRGNLSGLTIDTGRRIAPGNSVGEAITASQAWSNGGAYEFELTDAEGTAGTGWDTVTGSGTLDLSGLTAGGAFTVTVTTLDASGADGECANFDPKTKYVWPLATFAGVTGTFESAEFAVDASGFANEVDGTFRIVRDGHALVLQYSPDNGMLILVR